MPQHAIDAASTTLDAARAANAGYFVDADLCLAETLLLNALAQMNGGNVSKARLYAEAAKQEAEHAVRITEQKQRSATPSPTDHSGGSMISTTSLKT